MKMSLEDEYNVATRYRTVRKHLDSLGYKQALTLDALPLIEKLLADLIQTTDSLKHFKSIAQENIEAHNQLRSTIDPYKCDNVKLVQECNKLHLDLMKEKETHQKQIKDLKKEIYKFEHECNDLQLASSRNLHRIKELETESAKKSKRILELQGKCLKPTISNVALASKKRPVYPLRRPVIEGEPLPKTGTKSNPLPSLSTVEPKVVDLISMADHKMNCLSHEVTKLKGELSLQNDNVQTLKCQLATKEKEILRLKKMLDGGRPYSAVSRDCACKKGENSYAMSSHNVGVNELKVLQQEKLELEQQLKEAINKQHDAMTQALKLADRNEQLEKELRDIDHIALAVEADCNSAVKENNKRVSKLQEKLEDVMTRIHVLEGELTVERKEVQELRADLEACRLEKLNIQRNLESALDEKKYMTDRINELTVIEKNLNEEIGRMARENEKQRQDIIQLQYSNKMLKDQLNSKQILLDENGANLKASKEKGKKNDYNRERNGGNLHVIYKQREIFSNGNGSGYNNIAKQLEQKETEINDLQQAVEQLKGERDFYKNEYNNVKDNFSKTVDQDHTDLWSRIRELKQQLSERERALDELQREKKELLREKTNLETRSQSYKAEHKTSCRPCNTCKRGAMCNCSPPAMKDASKTKGIIERLEHERDIARADVERLIEERDALRERLKMAAEAHTSEQRRLRENLTDVETRLKQIEKERQELLLTQGARRATINGLEDQLQDVREELRRTKQELGTQRTQYFQLRALQDQTDQALGDAQNQLAQSNSELNKVLDRNRTMERQQLQLENQMKELQQEINSLKANMSHLDHEKDQLLMVLDEKTEKIATLEREIMLKEQHVMGSDHQIRELQHKNELCVDQNADQERQLRAMQVEMENLQRQLQTVSYDRENALQENRRVQDDLASVTCEVRNLQRELEASRAESSDLKRQLQTYVGEVRRAEDMLNRKENERTEMLNHFRSLSLEATVLENNNHSLESEAAEARGALQSVRDRMLDLERQLADKDSLIRGYETQISDLTQNVASMETQLRQYGEQKHRTEADLCAVRDLCMKLDQQKDTLMHQLDDKDALKTQCEMQIAKLKAEQAVIQDQMSKDRATMERLEMLLDQARQESITVQANNQELQNEMSRLRSKVSELQMKLSSESTKLRQYETQAAEYSKQISDLRRQVTNERFDRARLEEENRRQSDGLSNSLAQTPSPNNTAPNESNDTKSRYLQSETSRDPDGQSNRNGMKISHPLVVSRSGHFGNEENNCRCNHTKEFHRDGPCINIILRSDCKMHSNMYNNYVQKSGVQAENLPSLQKHKEPIRTDLKQLKDPSQLDSFDKKYDNSAGDTEDRFNLTQSYGTQGKREFEGNEDLSFNNVSRTWYNNGPVFPHDPIGASTFQSQLFSKADVTGLGQTTTSTKDSAKALSTSQKIKPSPNVNRFIERPMVSGNNFPLTKLESSLRELNGSGGKSFKATEPSFSYGVRQPDGIKQDTTKAPETTLKSILKNSVHYKGTEFRPKPVNTLDHSEFRITESLPKTGTYYRPYRDFFPERSFGTHGRYDNLVQFESTVLTSKVYHCDRNTCDRYNSAGSREIDTFHRDTLDTKKLADSSVQENGDFCTTSNCTETDCTVSNNLPRSDQSNRTAVTSWKSRSFRRVECDNKCISTIDSALDVLQNMLLGDKKFKDKDTPKYYVQDTMYQHREVRCKNMKCNYPFVKNKVTVPDADRRYTNLSEIVSPECMKMLQEIKRHTVALEEQLTIMSKSIRAKRKPNGKSEAASEGGTSKQRRDTVTQNPEKKNTYVQEPSLDHNFALRNDRRQSIPRQQTHTTKVSKSLLRCTCVQDKHHKKSNSKTRKCCEVDKLRKVGNVDTQCELSLSFHMRDSLNAKPLTMCTPERFCLSSYAQTISTAAEDSRPPEAREPSLNEQKSHLVERKNETINSVTRNGDNNCTSCKEDDVVMLLLTKSVNSSKCLKSKYKKLEFLNFRPKCIANSCDMYDHSSIRCKLSRRRSQKPVAYKLKSVCCTSKDYCERSENFSEHFASHSTKRCRVTDFERTIYTQSSDLQITSATSVPSIPFDCRYPEENYFDEETAGKNGCIIS